jgi:hypothetical protein
MPPHDGCQGVGGRRHVFSAFPAARGLWEATALFAVVNTRRPGQDSVSAGAELRW